MNLDTASRGPLVDLKNAMAGHHLNSYVQLVVFVLQRHPPQEVKTSKGETVRKTVLYVGDGSSCHVKVTLWNNHVCHNLCSGDIVFMRNMKAKEFFGHWELTCDQYSSMTILLERHKLMLLKGVQESAIDAWQYSPVVKERMKMVLEWVLKTQESLLTFLKRISNMHVDVQEEDNLSQMEACDVDIKRCGNDLDLQSKKCSSIKDVVTVEQASLISFDAKIREIYFPCKGKDADHNHFCCDCFLFSQRISGERSQEIFQELICIGCEECGHPQQIVNDGVYGMCYCVTSKKGTRQRQAGRIFRPFFAYLEDETGHIVVLVKHPVAVIMFANITAEHLFQSMCSCYDGAGQNVLPIYTDIKFNYCSIFQVLIQSLLSKKNSAFHFQAVHSRSARDHPLELVYFSLPLISKDCNLSN